mmetsp:Transcript_61771/g.177164  ORF Transcript_61771/g.177164 Transcript_61771/m.177164 type:complete len:83 (-) Transcript_61771:5-253(-)
MSGNTRSSSLTRAAQGSLAARCDKIDELDHQQRTTCFACTPSRSDDLRRMARMSGSGYVCGGDASILCLSSLSAQVNKIVFC